MMKQPIQFVLRSCVLAGLAAAFAANATQTVQPVKDAAGTAYSGSGTAWTGTAGLGTVVTVIGRYTTDNPTANESGLGLKVVYDEAKFTGVTVTPLITNCMIAPPQIQAGGAATKAVLGWIDTAARNPAGAVGWPYLADPATSTVIPITSPCLSPNTAPVNGTGANGPGAVNLFQFQGTLATGVGINGTATVQFLSEGNFSYATTTTPGMADQTLTITAAAAPGIALTATDPIVSRKTHGAFVGEIPISAAGVITGLGNASGATVEPRQATAANPHRIVFKFTGAVTAAAGGVAIAVSTGVAPTATTSFVGNEMIVELAGVTSGQRVSVNATDINGVGVNAGIVVGFLTGDVNGNRTLQPSDALFIQQRLGAANATNFRGDITVNGFLQPSDALFVQQRLGNSLQ